MATSPTKIRWRVVARVSIQDTLLLAVVVPIWVFVFHAANLWLLLGLGLVRTAYLDYQLLTALTPIEDWCERNDSAPDIPDAELLAMDAALQRGPARFGVIAMFSWIVVFGLATLAGSIGLPERLPIHAAELLCALLMLLGFSSGTLVITPAMIDPVLIDARSENFPVISCVW